MLIKKFNELSTLELYEIYKVRTAVFVVEQNCPYQEVDEIDLRSTHFLFSENNKTKAYLRVFKKDSDTAQIGRVLTTDRSKGYGKVIMDEAIRFIKKEGYKKIYLEAQCYAIDFYRKHGFVVMSEPFDEDGIPHVKMELNIKTPLMDVFC